MCLFDADDDNNKRETVYVSMCECVISSSSSFWKYLNFHEF